ncbi:hypothetical protein [Sorangium sp. So ce363]|uniref:hypothetical protein n=1 Tax=Sorangium sp. So ce363 TaxID=3133304 RepID=UPI003F638445
MLVENSQGLVRPRNGIVWWAALEIWLVHDDLATHVAQREGNISEFHGCPIVQRSTSLVAPGHDIEEHLSLQFEIGATADDHLGSADPTVELSGCVFLLAHLWLPSAVRAEA